MLVLEEAGYSVWFQDWDFRGNFVRRDEPGSRTGAPHTRPVLSDHYFGSRFYPGRVVSGALAQDPAAREDRLVPGEGRASH